MPRPPARPRKQDQQPAAPPQSAREAIIQRIRDGRYAPGRRLVMAELVAELGFSPSILRDALQTLGGEGVVELIPNKGARVPTLERADVINLLQCLEVLAQLGIDLAAQHLDKPGNVDRIKKAMQAIRSAARAGNSHELLVALPAYHYVINEIGGNSYLNYLLDRFHLDHFRRELINAMIARAMVGNHWETFVTQYEAITQQLLAGNAKGARKAFAEHMRLLMQLIQPS